LSNNDNEHAQWLVRYFMVQDLVRTMSNSTSTLYAFYDLATSSPKFDFLNFVHTAEFHRKRYDFENIYFVIVPGENDGFRESPLPPTDPVILRGMVRNIVLPGCWVLETCTGVSYLSTRGEARAFIDLAAGQMFPRDYTLKAPVYDNLSVGFNAALLRGEEITPFRAPPEYQLQADAYCRRVAGTKKLITITMRECPYHEQRNSQIDEWGKFIDTLDRDEYAIVIIRDTDQAYAEPLFEGIPECSDASVNLCFRLALYQKSYLTMHVSNGPSVVAQHALVPSITYGVLDDVHMGSTKGFIMLTRGQSYGDQWYGYPICQKLVWEKDTFEVIRDEFLSMVSILEQYPDGNYPSHEYSSQEHVNDTCAGILQYITGKMEHSFMPEDRDGLIRITEVCDSDVAAAAQNLLGVSYVESNEIEKAITAFQNTIVREPQYKTAHLNLAASFQRQGKHNSALEVFKKSLDVFGADLEILEPAINCAIVAGDMESAEHLIKVAVEANLDAEKVQNFKARIST
jgi:tetratricopeptide (TPR) repeat protein